MSNIIISILMCLVLCGCKEYYGTETIQYKQWIKETGLNPLMPSYYWMQRIRGKCPVCKELNSRERKVPDYNVENEFNSIAEADYNPPPSYTYEITMMCDKCGAHFTVKEVKIDHWLKLQRVYRAYGYEGN